jgi:hypothetical protein
MSTALLPLDLMCWRRSQLILTARRKFMSKLYDFLFLAGGGAPAAWTHNFMRAASRIATGPSPAPRERMRQASPIPTDTRLRDDIGLPPLVDDGPPLQQRLTLPAPAYFPTDNRLRDDIGLPPLGASSDAAAER